MKILRTIIIALSVIVALFFLANLCAVILIRPVPLFNLASMIVGIGALALSFTSLLLTEGEQDD